MRIRRYKGGTGRTPKVYVWDWWQYNMTMCRGCAEAGLTGRHIEACNLESTVLVQQLATNASNSVLCGLCIDFCTTAVSTTNTSGACLTNAHTTGCMPCLQRQGSHGGTHSSV